MKKQTDFDPEFLCVPEDKPYNPLHSGSAEKHPVNIKIDQGAQP